MNTITVYLIVKNKEKVLLCCLNNLKEIAYKIVLVDSGSADCTILPIH